MKHEKIGRVSSASVLKGSGKNWDQWIALLDKAGARSWTHQEIVAYLKKKHKLGPWWQQGVTHGYEIAIGRREPGQDQKGKYMVTTTKSVHQSAKALWKVVASEAGKNAWLLPMYEIPLRAGQAFETSDGFFGEIRTLQAGRRIRMSWSSPDWEGSTTVELLVVARANGNSILCFNHTKIADLKTQAKVRTRWKKAVEELAKLLASDQDSSGEA